MRDHHLTIRTPEGITFALPLAGPLSRFLAWLVDGTCLLVGYILIYKISFVLGFINFDLSRALSLVVFFILNMGYAMLLEWHWQGQTLGKRALGLRVMDVRGLHLQLSQIVIRNLLRMIDSLPFFYLLGGAACLISRHAQRLGDIAANTIVIREAKVVEPDLDFLLEQVRYNSLRDYPHLVARLRQQATPEEAALALHALVRRDDLAPESRVGLFAEIADHFRQKVVFPPEALEGVSDEQFMRNVVDVLFRSAR